jgi:hypothetical protein
MKIKCAKQPLINISMWNIEGLVNSKLSDEHVLDIIAYMLLTFEHFLSVLDYNGVSLVKGFIHI